MTKIEVLGEYLELDPEGFEGIEEELGNVLSFNGDKYLVLTDDELDKAIETRVNEMIEATQDAIYKADISRAASDYTYWMYLSVDEELIKEDIEENYTDYLANGEDDEWYDEDEEVNYHILPFNV